MSAAVYRQRDLLRDIPETFSPDLSFKDKTENDYITHFMKDWNRGGNISISGVPLTTAYQQHTHKNLKEANYEEIRLFLLETLLKNVNHELQEYYLQFLLTSAHQESNNQLWTALTNELVNRLHEIGADLNLRDNHAFTMTDLTVTEGCLVMTETVKIDQLLTDFVNNPLDILDVDAKATAKHVIGFPDDDYTKGLRCSRTDLQIVCNDQNAKDYIRTRGIWTRIKDWFKDLFHLNQMRENPVKSARSEWGHRAIEVEPSTVRMRR